MRALIQFNSSKTWDELLAALDKPLLHVIAVTPVIQQTKTLPHLLSSRVKNLMLTVCQKIKEEAISVLQRIWT